MNKRHKLFYEIFRPVVALFLRLRFGYRYEKAENLPENYIVLANHTTDWDALMVASAFKKQMYFVASEHIARWDHWYKLVNYLVQPILRAKGTAAMSTVIEMLRVTRNGGNVCLFAEGNRSWDGITCPILPATGKTIKKAKCGMVTYRLEGGYFISPRWSENLRRGPVYGKVANVYTKEQLAEMSVEEINEVINRDLYEDAYERQLASPKRYKGKRLAEKMENFLFMCPECGKIDTMTSCDDTVTCSECGHSFRYTEYGMLEGTKFETIRELSFWQQEETAKVAAAGGGFGAGRAKLIRIEKHTEFPVADAELYMDGENLRCGETVIPFDIITDFVMHGKKGIVFTAGKEYYELKPADGFNALKFVLLYEALKKEA